MSSYKHHHTFSQVRILKRDPNNASSGDGKSEDGANKRTHKTLAQREAEYASARYGIADNQPHHNFRSRIVY